MKKSISRVIHNAPGSFAGIYRVASWAAAACLAIVQLIRESGSAGGRALDALVMVIRDPSYVNRGPIDVVYEIMFGRSKPSTYGASRPPVAVYAALQAAWGPNSAFRAQIKQTMAAANLPAHLETRFMEVLQKLWMAAIASLGLTEWPEYFGQVLQPINGASASAPRPIEALSSYVAEGNIASLEKALPPASKAGSHITYNDAANTLMRAWQSFAVALGPAREQIVAWQLVCEAARWAQAFDPASGPYSRFEPIDYLLGTANAWVTMPGSVTSTPPDLSMLHHYKGHFVDALTALRAHPQISDVPAADYIGMFDRGTGPVENGAGVVGPVFLTKRRESAGTNLVIEASISHSTIAGVATIVPDTTPRLATLASHVSQLYKLGDDKNRVASYISKRLDAPVLIHDLTQVEVRTLAACMATAVSWYPVTGDDVTSPVDEEAVNTELHYHFQHGDYPLLDGLISTQGPGLSSTPHPEIVLSYGAGHFGRHVYPTQPGIADVLTATPGFSNRVFAAATTNMATPLDVFVDVHVDLRGYWRAGRDLPRQITTTFVGKLSLATLFEATTKRFRHVLVSSKAVLARRSDASVLLTALEAMRGGSSQNMMNAWGIDVLSSPPAIITNPQAAFAIAARAPNSVATSLEEASFFPPLLADFILSDTVSDALYYLARTNNAVIPVVKTDSDAVLEVHTRFRIARALVALLADATVSTQNSSTVTVDPNAPEIVILDEAAGNNVYVENLAMRILSAVRTIS